MDPGTAAIAVLSTIAGVSGYGAMKINSNQAMVMQELATRLAAEKIEKLRREKDDEFRLKEQKYQSETAADKQKIAELDRSIADLRADAGKLNADLQQATEGERLFSSVSLTGFKKAIKTFQKNREATDGDDALGPKISAAVKKVFEKYTSSARLNVSRGSMVSFYNDLSKASGKSEGYMDPQEFQRSLTEIFRGVDASLQGDRVLAEEQRKTDQLAQRTAAATAAAAELQRRKSEKEEAARLKEAEKAEKEAAKAAEAQRKEEAKAAATKQASTQIHDTLMTSMKDALQWYNSTIDSLESKVKNELEVFRERAPNDTSINDNISETGKYMGFLIKYKNLLNRKYMVYKGKIGTNKFNVIKYIRGQDNEYKPLDESFFEKNPKPLPPRELKLPIEGGKKIRRKGGALESLIASRKDINMELEFFEKVKSHVQSYIQTLDTFIRTKRTEILEKEESGDEPLPEPTPEVKPEEDETVFEGVNPVTQQELDIADGKPIKSIGYKNVPARKEVVRDLKGYQSNASRKMASDAKTTRRNRRSDNATRRSVTPSRAESAPAPAPAPAAEPAAEPAPQPARELTAAERNPPLAPSPFGRADRSGIEQNPLRRGGPLPRGGLRKRKLRTRRGGKQKKDVRRTRRS